MISGYIAASSLPSRVSRHGGKHDWYTNPETGVSQPVPRHAEVNEHLAIHILRSLRS
ncbi:MAG: addiction module toxin, HicA family [Candidatus Solibacter sp.]|nr:addiction module toxin, HicA family [Candidatus Solibacter sp.]